MENGVPLGLVAIRGCPDPRGVVPKERTLSRKLPGPAGFDQTLSLGTARERREDGRASGLLRAQQKDLAGVMVRSALFDVGFIVVIPHRDQAEVPHRRERRRTRPYNNSPLARDDLKKRAISRARAIISGKPRIGMLPHNRIERFGQRI